MSQREVEAALWGKRSKYNIDQSRKGKEKRTFDNIVFHSEHEMAVYRDYLKPNVNAGIFRNLRLQHPFPLFAFDPRSNLPVIVAYYVADAVFEDTDNKTHVVDAKGVLNATYKLKKKIFEVCYPDLRIEEL